MALDVESFEAIHVGGAGVKELVAFSDQMLF